MKIFEGVVISLATKTTAIVEITRKVSHPLYKKLLKRSKRFKVDTRGAEVLPKQKARIIEVRPISKEKHFIFYQEKGVKSLK